MIASIRDNDELQMNAYCDGELDPASAIEFERRLANDEFLKARYIRLISLRRAVRSLPQPEMPPGLRARINSKLDADRVGQTGRPGQAARQRPRSWSFQALAAAAVFGAVISSSVMLTMERYDLREDVARQVVAGHIRGQLASQPFDVASSDRHTVKPWFTSRLPESPQVPDLAAQGFVLVGGPQLERCAVHLHCRFGLGQLGSRNVRARIFHGIACAGSQIVERGSLVLRRDVLTARLTGLSGRRIR